MKKSFFLSILLSISTFIFGQQELLVQNSDKGLYLRHTVAPKEGLYAIGRLYNLSAKEIADYNGIDLNQGLNVGQELRIPLNHSNFSQSATKGQAVYYVVEPSEGLYRVSVKNNNVQLASIRQWNHLNGDQISAGQKLIIGYLVGAGSVPSTVTTPVKEPVQKQEGIKTEIRETEPEIKTEVPRSEPEKKPETPVVRPVSQPAIQTAVTDGSGGFFRTHFEQQVKSHATRVDETVSAGIFKTASGWQDAKYYVLIDKVEPGTIIRIINPTNNKSVYAKGLGEMRGIRQNQGYDLRMSNAAASALEVTDMEKFIVRVIY